jgi:hypothetical protein
MKKTKIKSGYIVELKNGMRFNVTRVGKDKPIHYLINNRFKMTLSDNFDDDLRAKTDETRAYDIERVWGFPDKPENAFDLLNVENRKVLYKRPYAKKMTKNDIEQKLGFNIEIVDEE